MSNLIAIVGESGSGKSTSIRTLNSEETFIINVASKPLPFKGWRSKYSTWNKENPNGNFVNTSDVDQIYKILAYVNSKRPEIKNVVIEDAQKFYMVLKMSIQMRDDMNVFVLCHSENGGSIDEPKFKIKTIGKMIDNTITVEGLFTYVLFTNVERTSDNKVEYSFITHSDGSNTAKTPIDCFEEDLIPNDLQYVVDKINEYNN